ncbi:dipeptidyl peptidase 4 [Clupea harengus]|uniref:Dipeptidyl peptidase 4 n=1 Tax=Clupea harengus TaxID=7950 RepID=A0A6P8ERU1_CLUHA|nr:dipeptidyl peptidase 4 [Clupea harengus]
MKSIGKWILGILGLVVVVVLIAVPTAIFLNEEKTEAQRTFTLADNFNSSIRARSYNLRWISDQEYVHRGRDGVVYKHSAATSDNEGVVFLEKTKFDQVEAFDYLISGDNNYVAFMSNFSKLWRHSYTASYTLYDLSSKGFLDTVLPDDIQYLAWAPAGSAMAYVWKNNVYVKASPTGAVMQVTTNGKDNLILNGIPDWVYEEEMFSTNHALWWSPGGKHVAYAEFNDTDVPIMEYSWYGKGQYPQTVMVPYPKPGAENPTVRLFVVDVNTSRVEELVVPNSYGADDHYLSTVTWVSDSRVAIQWQKRLQSHVLLQVYERNGTSWVEGTKHEQIMQNGWVGRFSPSEPVFAADGNSFYLIESDTTGYKHINHVTGSSKTFITKGNWEVISILKVTSNTIFFVGNQGHPGQRNVYKIRITIGTSSPECLTCNLDPERCKYNSASISSDGSYYRMDCSGPGLPLYTLRSSSGKDSEVKVLEDNTNLDAILKEIAMPSVIHDTIKIGKYELWYQMTLPPGFDKSKKYPVLIDVYAGPCSQKSDFRFRLGWSTYLASTEKVIVASFDGRGSGFQGDEIMHLIYKRLGTYEVEDQITAARQFIDLGFIDKERIAIWGWSYGGYVTSMVLGAGSGVFKCGMAVAPVSKWEYYDSIYTERYMQRPQDNQAFYDNSTVTGRAKNFASVEYLLIHGTADDNVHFQQAAQISKALVDEQVDFEAMWYTDEDHGLGGSAYHHVYTHMSHFLQRCFA